MITRIIAGDESRGGDSTSREACYSEIYGPFYHRPLPAIHNGRNIDVTRLTTQMRSAEVLASFVPLITLEQKFARLKGEHQ